MLGFEPLPSPSQPCCPTHCPMGSNEISDKCQSNYKNMWPNRDSNPIYCLKNFCPHRTSETIYLIIKIVGRNTLIKKEKRPY